MEKFRVGARVKFLDDIGSGEVTRLVDKDLVMVRTDDGFEYPVLKSELLISSDAEDMTGVDQEEVVLPQTQLMDEKKEIENSKEEKQEGGEEKRVDYEASLDSKGIDKDSKFYRKAVKALEREKAREKKKAPDIEEVDLHIGEILDNYSDMTSGEIVEVQLARFRTSLEGALRAGQKRLVYIHGKGAGKLKRDIARIIDSEYPNCRHQDASFAEYGYGATLVIIK